jgi:hypothetical protein
MQQFVFRDLRVGGWAEADSFVFRMNKKDADYYNIAGMVKKLKDEDKKFFFKMTCEIVVFGDGE